MIAQICSLFECLDNNILCKYNSKAAVYDVEVS